MAADRGFGFATERDMRRIASAVLSVEKRMKSRLLRGNKRRMPYLPSRLFRAAEDIPNGDRGDCHPAGITSADEFSDDTDVTRSALNLLLPKIWNDCYFGAQYIDGSWVPVIAYSATIVWGQLTAACTGGTFAIDGIKGLDGAYPAGGTLSGIVNPFGMEGDDNGEVIAQWDDDTEAWMGIQMECPAE